MTISLIQRDFDVYYVYIKIIVKIVSKKNLFQAVYMGNAHNLLSSYLSNRTQYTSVLNENSEKAHVEYGVPQGSVLGPVLFLIYILMPW